MNAPLSDEIARAEGPLACAFCDGEKPLYDLVCAACIDALGGGPALARLHAVAGAAKAYRATYRARGESVETYEAEAALDAALAALEGP